jgi:hypothetical protein
LTSLKHSPVEKPILQRHRQFEYFQILFGKYFWILIVLFCYLFEKQFKLGILYPVDFLYGEPQIARGNVSFHGQPNTFLFGLLFLFF